MIDRAPDAPGEPGILRSSVRDDLERLREAANERSWREFVRELRDATAALHRATKIVETAWIDVSDEDQDLFLLVKDVLDDIVSSGPRPHPTLVQMVKAKVSGSDDEEKRLVWQFAVAVGAFMHALDQALHKEERTRAVLDGTMTADPEAVATIERGIQEQRGGLGKLYTSEEFQARFGLS